MTKSKSKKPVKAKPAPQAKVKSAKAAPKKATTEAKGIIKLTAKAADAKLNEGSSRHKLVEALRKNPLTLEAVEKLLGDQARQAIRVLTKHGVITAS